MNFSDTSIDFLRGIVTQMIFHHSVSFILISTRFTFNKRIVFRKKIFQATLPVVYAVGMTKDFESFLANIIIHNSLKFSLNITKF